MYTATAPSLRCLSIAFALTILADASANPSAQSNTLRIAVANTAGETGIMEWLFEDFQRVEPQIDVRFEMAGALQVLDYGRTGRADVVITHHPPSELAFIKDGFGTRRANVMTDEFAIFGPPEKVKRFNIETDIRRLMQTLAADEVPFYAPDPRSGTYLRLSEIWGMAGITPNWVGYEHTGVSSAAALRTAALFDGFAFADMGTYLSHRQHLNGRLVPLYRDNSALRNVYSALIVNAERVSGVNTQTATRFFNYLIADAGQRRISSFVHHGAKLFEATAHLDDQLRATRAEEKFNDQQRILYLFIAMLAVILMFLMLVTWLWRRARRLQRLHYESEQRFRLAVEGSNDGIWDWDLLENTLTISSRLREMIGMPPDQSILNKPVRRVLKWIHADDRHGVVEQLRGLIYDPSQVLIAIEFRYLTGNETYCWVLLRGKALRDDNQRVVRVTGSLTDLTHIKQHALLQHQALHDAVTGLPNRLLLMDRLNQALITAQRDTTQVGVVMIDLDKFKVINDTRGHYTGDVALQHAAQIFKRAVRSSDTVARLGGDEFVILLLHTDAESIQCIADVILSALREPIMILGQPADIGASIGIALYPEHGDSAEHLLKRADQAMYAAKRTGNNWQIAAA